jgi:hypothetical protein
VISSLAKRLEKPHFYHSYTTFGVWPRDHYIPLQRSTTRVCHALLWFPRKGPTCSAKDSRQRPLLHHVGLGENNMPIPHSINQGKLHIVFLISKQVVPYWTCGETCCPGVSTHKIRSLVDLSNHVPWRYQPSPPFQPLLKPQHLSSPRSTHISTNGRPQLSHKDTSHTQHQKGWKTCTPLKTVGLSITNQV